MRKNRIAIIFLFLCVHIISACLASETLDDGAIQPTPTPVPTAAPVENNDFILDVQLGYDGLIVLNRWMPAFVTVTNNGPDFEGLIGVNVFQTETSYDRYEMPLTLARGAAKSIQVPIKPRMRQDMYAFELVGSEKIVAETRVRPTRLIPPETVCVGLLSDDPARLSYFTQRVNGLNTLRGEAWITVPLGAASFPDSGERMKTFSLLVVDGFDASILTVRQRDTLMEWLSKGGVAIVSGGAKAASGYPFFEPWTGVSASTIKEVEDITPALLGYITAFEQPLDEKMWINPIPPEKSLLSAGENGVIALTSVNDGLIYLTAFDIGGKAFSGWPVAPVFWPRAIRQSMPNFYAKMLETKDQYDYGGVNYRIFELVRNAKIPNTESGVPVIVIMIAYVLLCGIGGYFLLKRIDKSEWMWVFTPACAVLFALVLLLMSYQSTINLPVALSTSQITADGQTTRIDTYISVARPHAGELTVETDQNQLPTVLRSDDYYYDRGAMDGVLFRPLNLIQRYLYGDSPSIGFASNEAWDPRTVEVNQGGWNESAVAGSLWVEEDGIHGEMTNQTDSVLTDCAVITIFGYDRLGDILPGQRAEFSLLPPEKPIQYDAPDFVYEPGVMYTPDEMSAQTAYSRVYFQRSPSDFITAMTFDSQKAAYRSPELEMENMLIFLFEQQFSLYQNTMNSYFFGFSDQLGQIAVKINGEPVTRTSHQSVVGYTIPFEPVGPTGVVLYPQGYIVPEVVVDMGDGEKPRLPTPADGIGVNDNLYSSTDPYIRYSSPVSLRFVLPDSDRITIEKITMAASFYDSVPNFYLYNHQTEEWDKQRTLSIAVTGELCLPYFDEEGALFVRYTPTDSTGRYDSMQKPLLSVKGKVK